MHAQNTRAQKNYLEESLKTTSPKKKKKSRKKKINHCSLGVGSAGVMVVGSSITSAMVVASSITFSTVALEGRLASSSFSTSP